MSKFLGVLVALFCLLSFASLPASAYVAIVPIEYSGPPMIGPHAGPVFFTPRAIVVHHSGDANVTAANATWQWAGYRRFHMETVHPGVYPEWTGIYIAQEGYPDGLSWPNQYGTNDIDYHGGVAPGGAYFPGRDLRTVGWGAGGNLPGMPEINTYALHLCFMGNFNDHAPDAEQYKTGVAKAAEWMIQFNILFDQLYYHYEIRYLNGEGRGTDCPGYSFPEAQFREDVRLAVAGFYDLSYNDWEWTAVQQLTSARIVTGFANHYLYPDAMLTRAEAVNLLWKLSGSPTGSAAIPGLTDISDSWAFEAIRWAKLNGIVNGYPDSTFRPNAPLSRAEMCTIISRWKSLPLIISDFPDVSLNYWASEEIGACQTKGYVNGYEDGKFRPDNGITRAEAFSLIARAIK
jgi:hypothetical protein